MNKENKRDFTVKQMEKRLKVVSTIGIISLILVLPMIFTFISSSSSPKEILEMLTDWKFIVSLFLVVIIIIAAKITDKLNTMIKIRVIKDCAEYGMLKESASIKSQDMIEKLLVRSIEGLSMYKEDDNTLMAIMEFNDDIENYQLSLPVKEFLSIIDEKTKKQLLEKLVKDIQFDTETNELMIRSANKKLYEKVISDNDLIEFFEYRD